MKYGLGAGPAYSAALAALIVIASDPSPERPTFLDVAKAFDVSMPSLKRRYMRLVEGVFRLSNVAERSCRDAPGLLSRLHSPSLETYLQPTVIMG